MRLVLLTLGVLFLLGGCKNIPATVTALGDNKNTLCMVLSGNAMTGNVVIIRTGETSLNSLTAEDGKCLLSGK